MKRKAGNKRSRGEPLRKGEGRKARPGKRLTLDELLRGLKPESRHEEVDWGAPQGAEFH